MVIGPLHLDIHWKKTNKQKITILNYVSSLFVLSKWVPYSPAQHGGFVTRE